MDEEQQPTKPDAPHFSSTEAASELNNLLQIIAGSSTMIEDTWEGRPAPQYFTMLRESIARAAQVTTELVERTGRASGKIVLHPEFARLQKEKMHRTNAPKHRILVVDDEKMLLILTAEILREAGYEVVTAHSGFECLDELRTSARPFDLVLLDFNMPLMDGEETFHRLRALEPDLRVMLCTGYIQQERLNHMLDAGLCGFVQKPLGPKEYLASVKTLLADPPTQPVEPGGQPGTGN